MNVYDLVAKITLDDSEYNDSLNDTETKTKSFGDRLKGGLATAGKVGAAAVGVATAAIGAASGAVVSLTKSAVSGYADYEQLVGGLETMFEDMSWDVEQNAKNAFKTAGLSANEYMETVMGFSAALNQSLTANEGNIARSADLSDQIIRDMSDNANKMGTDMSAIQTAYAGFSKQNYTMLDNLNTMGALAA